MKYMITVPSFPYSIFDVLQVMMLYRFLSARSTAVTGRWF